MIFTKKYQLVLTELMFCTFLTSLLTEPAVKYNWNLNVRAKLSLKICQHRLFIRFYNFSKCPVIPLKFESDVFIPELISVFCWKDILIVSRAVRKRNIDKLLYKFVLTWKKQLVKVECLLIYFFSNNVNICLSTQIFLPVLFLVGEL